MAHRTLKSGYTRLVDRINRHPQGARESELLYSILKLLVDEKEAELVALVPMKPFTAGEAADIWKMDLPAARKVLDGLADRAFLVDVEMNGDQHYVLPPPMAGFFEFSMMRIRDDIDQKKLGELLYQYLNVEEGFIRDLFTQGQTQIGRVFVNEASLSDENALHVLDYERASEVIEKATHRGIGVCYCRHKMQHVGRACDAPLDICMTFNRAAAGLINRGYIRSVDKQECMDLLQEAYDRNLVQFGENVKQEVNFICNCCGCCCEAMRAARKFALFNPVHTTNFTPAVDGSACTGCGKCVEVCPVGAMGLTQKDENGHRHAVLRDSVCLGCGVCVRNCSKKALSLQSRPKRVVTPLDTAHRVVEMAIERGKLQHFIVSNQALWSHRALATILGVILKLPPIKQLLAMNQMKSRYLHAVLSREFRA